MDVTIPYNFTEMPANTLQNGTSSSTISVMESTTVLRSFVRRNHIGQFTASLVLSSGGTLHAWGASKDLAIEAVYRKLDNLNAYRNAAGGK